MSDSNTEPAFGLALVAVLAAGMGTSWISMLFVGFAPYVNGDFWSLATDLLGGSRPRADRPQGESSST